MHKQPNTIELEIVNSITHGIGVLFGIASIPLLSALAVRSDNTPAIVGACIYGFCFMMLFTFSTSYHGFQQAQVKNVLKVLDHISIYFLIAGTYTPFLLTYMFNPSGITMLCILWGLAFAGTIFKVFFVHKFNVLSTIVYLLMGWMLVWPGRMFFSAMPAPVITLIAVGGGLYSMGVIFYLWHKWKWHHAIWHLFVLAAAVCHYVAVLLTVSK